jgi:hypothetical protein
LFRDFSVISAQQLSATTWPSSDIAIQSTRTRYKASGFSVTSVPAFIHLWKDSSKKYLKNTSGYQTICGDLLIRLFIETLSQAYSISWYFFFINTKRLFLVCLHALSQFFSCLEQNLARKMIASVNCESGSLML